MGHPPVIVRSDEEEWEERQRVAGVCARLVRYEVGVLPREDIILGGGGDVSASVRVAAIRPRGQACTAGVKVGDKLVSIDGRNIGAFESAEVLQRGLSAPSTLVFLGFVGKLNAEVRLTTKLPICGLSLRYQLFVDGTDYPRCRGGPPATCSRVKPQNISFHVEDQVEFYDSPGAFFITGFKPLVAQMKQDDSKNLGVADEWDTIDAHDATGSGAAGGAAGGAGDGIFELKAAEARNLVGYALRARQAALTSQVII